MEAGDVALRTMAHGGRTPLLEPPVCWEESRHLRGLLPGFTDTAQH